MRRTCGADAFVGEVASGCACAARSHRAVRATACVQPILGGSCLLPPSAAPLPCPPPCPGLSRAHVLTPASAVGMAGTYGS